jgi:hypothetical membrane protein
MHHARRLGALAWISAIQFFVTQIVVASAWARPFSLSQDYISDLGNTVCGMYPAGSTHDVCSPWHAAMNGSFMLLGVTMTLGAVLLRGRFKGGWVRSLAIALFTLAGLGVILVGVYPENTNNARHVFGAALNFISGNIALILFGVLLKPQPRHALLSACGVVGGTLGLVATGLFVSGHYLGLGLGGMERVAAYPMTVWQVVMGTWVATTGWRNAS